jgi:hypothetical protein
VPPDFFISRFVDIMDVQGIRDAIRREPFAPFTMRLADGRSLPVPHPEFVAVHPRRVILIAEDGSWSVIEPLMVVSLDYDGSGTQRGDAQESPSHPEHGS